MISSFRNKLGTDGFTILEMLIAIVILVFISLGIYQALYETFKLRDVLSEEGDFYNSIRMSMDIVRRDVALIYSPQLILPPSPSPSPGAAPGANTPFGLNPSGPGNNEDLADLLEPTKYWGAALDKTGIRPSRFTGTASTMTFISVSHIRIYKDAPESEFAKIAYEFVRDDSGPTGTTDDGSVMKKTENPNAFAPEDTKDKHQVVYPLLRGITKFNLRYYRKDKDQWASSWDSDREETKNLYPDIVELTLEVKGPQNLSFEGTYEFRPEVPLRGIDPSS